MLILTERNERENEKSSLSITLRESKDKEVYQSAQFESLRDRLMPQMFNRNRTSAERISCIALKQSHSRGQARL